MSFLKRFVVFTAVLAVLYTTGALLTNPRRTSGWRTLEPVIVDEVTRKSRVLAADLREGPVRGLVLGSSRSLLIPARTCTRITGSRFFNFAVSGATIDECTRIYDMARRQGASPAVVILGLDMDRLLTRRKVELRRHAMARGDLFPALLQKAQVLKSICNIEYAQDITAAVQLNAGVRARKRGNIFEPDGDVREEREDPKPPEEYLSAVRKCAETMREQFLRYDSVSDLAFADLHALLVRAHNDHAAVSVFSTPMNPDATDKMIRGTAYATLVAEATVRVKKELGQYDFSFSDLARTETLPTGRDEWNDCVHYKARIGNQLTKVLLDGGTN